VQVYLLARKCMNAAQPPGTFAPDYFRFVDLDPEGDERFTKSTPAGAMWSALEHDIEPGGLPPHGPVVFMHRMQTPSGAERLVVVERWRDDNFTAIVVDPGSIWRYPSNLTAGPIQEDSRTRAVIESGPNIRGGERVSSMQPDAHDASRFTFRFEMSGEATDGEGRIDDRNVMTIRLFDLDDFYRRVGLKNHGAVGEFLRREKQE
jgi:hypothetical protein